MLPFSHEQFVGVFAEYNRAIWPAQVLAYAVGLALCVLAQRRTPRSGPWIGCGLAVLWAWTGAVYHAVFFSRINALAMAFGAAFLLQASLLLLAGTTGRLRFDGGRPPPAWRTAVGWSLVAYAALVYPILGAASGMAYPAAPAFGVTPCPLTLFTWGLLLVARAAPWWLLPVPFAWSLIGGSAAILLRVPQDWLLLASPVCGLLVPLARRTTPVHA